MVTQDQIFVSGAFLSPGFALEERVRAEMMKKFHYALDKAEATDHVLHGPYVDGETPYPWMAKRPDFEGEFPLVIRPINSDPSTEWYFMTGVRDGKA